MTLRMLGCHHRNTPLEVRERLAFSPSEVGATLAAFTNTFPQFETVLLSTCNRVEFYLCADDSTDIDRNTVTTFLLNSRGIDITADDARAITAQLHWYQEMDVVSHLFRVTSSLESMVLGESQILSQVKNAYQIALDAGTAGAVLNRLFQAALKTAKRVTAETEIGKYRLSIPSVAVGDFVLRLFERLSNRTALIMGAGEMAEETIRYLKANGMERIIVCNRHRERADELAAAWDADVVDWEERLRAIVEVDMAVGTTGAPEPILTTLDYKTIEPLRQGRPLFLLDLAVPRNFEPTLADCQELYLYSLDDLREVCESNRQRRDREVPKAERIIKQESDTFIRDLNHQQTGQVIRALRDSWEKMKESEIERLLNKLSSTKTVEKETENEIRYAFDRLINKLIHNPLESLREESKEKVPHGLMDAIRRLFGLR
ncbi:MAG: glutamyl-tRNA reductase [Planctomycetaceae bacterium]|jgi:glutamyl-tRNA reductase|nr:glutamyl-tRNA reductase [Planctomycetaceae bacterium]